MDARKIDGIRIEFTILGVGQLTPATRQACLDFLAELVGDLDPDLLLEVAGAMQIFTVEGTATITDHGAIVTPSGEIVEGPVGGTGGIRSADMPNVLGGSGLESHHAGPAELLGSDPKPTSHDPKDSRTPTAPY